MPAPGAVESAETYSPTDEVDPKALSDPVEVLIRNALSATKRTALTLDPTASTEPELTKSEAPGPWIDTPWPLPVTMIEPALKLPLEGPVSDMPTPVPLAVTWIV